LALQIDDQIVFDGAQLCDQPRRGDKRRKTPRRRAFVAG
jgi:hypothetical protein